VFITYVVETKQCGIKSALCKIGMVSTYKIKLKLLKRKQSSE